MKLEDAVHNKGRPPRQRGSARSSAGVRRPRPVAVGGSSSSQADSLAEDSPDDGASDPRPRPGGELGADQRSVAMPVDFGRARAESAAPERPGIRVDRDGSRSPPQRLPPFGRGQSDECADVATMQPTMEPTPAPVTSGSVKERARAMQALADQASR